MDLKSKVEEAFLKQFKQEPAFLIQAPGRVNLIGEHTDYNDGFVLPMAINRSIWFAVRPRDDGRIKVASLDFKETIDFGLTEIVRIDSGWGEYVQGMAWALLEHGYKLRGWEGVFSGDIPIGAGLSSSAAVELGVAMAFSRSSNFEWVPPDMAKIGQYTENNWVGVQSGIMDQTIIASGVKNHAIMIDCRNLDRESVALPDDMIVVILDTNTRRGLVGSAYNERREQCEAAAAHFGVAALRDVSIEMFEDQKDELDPTTRKRARHIIYENQRVLDAVNSLQKGDTKRFGHLMNESHESMRDDFEISRVEMDAMVTIAQTETGCIGARMTGGGFGGCAVALVGEVYQQQFSQNVAREYEAQTGLTPDIYVTGAEDGVRSRKF